MSAPRSPPLPRPGAVFRSADGSSHLYAVFLGDFLGTMDAGQELALSSFGMVSDLKATAGAGAWVFARDNLYVTRVTAAHDLSATSFGDVYGEYLSNAGNTTITAGEFIGTARGMLDVTVQAKPDVAGSVTATTGNASVVSANAVRAGVTGRDVVVAALNGSVTGNVSASQDARVVAQGNIQNVTYAARDALVWALGNVGASISNTITAARDATVGAGGNVKSPVIAGGRAEVTAGVLIDATASAGGDAKVVARTGAITKNVTAGNDGSAANETEPNANATSQSR